MLLNNIKEELYSEMNIYKKKTIGLCDFHNILEKMLQNNTIIQRQ